VGKPIGITLFARLASVVGLGRGPQRSTWSQISAPAGSAALALPCRCLSPDLALGNGDLLDMSKIGTLAASIAAGCVGSILLLKGAKTLTAVKA